MAAIHERIEGAPGDGKETQGLGDREQVLIRNTWQNMRDAIQESYEEAIPAFLALVMIPFTYSITHGIVFAIISYVIIKVVAGKIKQINAWLWLTFVFSIFALIAPLFF